MNQQTSFAEGEYGRKKKTTRLEEFLAQMETVVPWARLVEVHHRPEGKNPKLASECPRAMRRFIQCFPKPCPQFQRKLTNGLPRRCRRGRGSHGMWRRRTGRRMARLLADVECMAGDGMF